MPPRAYERLDVDERRRRLLEIGAGLFTRHAYDEISMATIAREAGISKALLYHYFPSKQAMFTAMLEERAGEVAARTTPDPGLPLQQQLEVALDGFLGWVEENATAYAKFIRSSGIPEVRELTDGVREATVRRVVEGLGGDARMRGVARAWLWFLDGAILGWIEHGDLTRDQVRDAALGALAGALAGDA
jgi:AcrR family transcriptional regulator